MANQKGSNYIKEIDSGLRGNVGELASKLRCSFDSWVDPTLPTPAAIVAGNVISLMIHIPVGARIKAVSKSAHSNDEVNAPSTFQIKDKDGNVLADNSDAIGKKLSAEAKLLELTATETAPGALSLANITSGYIFVEFLLD